MAARNLDLRFGKGTDVPASEKPLRVSAESMTTTELELAVLRALCALPGGDDARAKVANELKAYRWKHADHLVIYEALMEINSADRQALRRELPAAVTRMGFPDINWERFFAANATTVPPDRIFELIRELKAGVSGR
jgi:hypothetical protein